VSRAAGAGGLDGEITAAPAPSLVGAQAGNPPGDDRDHDQVEERPALGISHRPEVAMQAPARRFGLGGILVAQRQQGRFDRGPHHRAGGIVGPRLAGQLAFAPVPVAEARQVLHRRGLLVHGVEPRPFQHLEPPRLLCEEIGEAMFSEFPEDRRQEGIQDALVLLVQLLVFGRPFALDQEPARGDLRHAAHLGQPSRNARQRFVIVALRNPSLVNDPANIKVHVVDVQLFAEPAGAPAGADESDHLAGVIFLRLLAARLPRLEGCEIVELLPEFEVVLLSLFEPLDRRGNVRFHRRFPPGFRPKLA
jgi:hypothetical protein